jgi:hypothetical protein
LTPFRIDSLGQKNLEQGLAWDISLVGQRFHFRYFSISDSVMSGAEMILILGKSLEHHFRNHGRPTGARLHPIKKPILDPLQRSGEAWAVDKEGCSSCDPVSVMFLTKGLSTRRMLLY